MVSWKWDPPILGSGSWLHRFSQGLRHRVDLVQTPELGLHHDDDIRLRERDRRERIHRGRSPMTDGRDVFELLA